MNLTSRSRYALKIMMDLALYGANQPLVRRGDIASRQGIPTDYLDQIMVKLRAGNLVESIRGRSGGYRLARPANAITMWDLFSSVEDSMIPVECISSGQVCDFEASCSSKEAWGTIFAAIRSSLSGITLGSLASTWAGEYNGILGQASIAMAAYPTVRECRGGRKSDASELTGHRRESGDQSGGVSLDG